MLSIHLIKLGHEDYYLDLLDYYLKAGGNPTWIGGLAEVFHLKGQTVEREQFKRLLRGQHPTANQSGSDSDDDDPPPLSLVQNAGSPNRQAAWDHTFSAPKSVSVIWSSASPEMAKSIEQSQQLAVEETISFAEDLLAYSRMGKGGTEIVPAKIIAASILDLVSRAGDPQIHTHTLVQNIGYCPDGQCRSILSRPFYKNKILLGALYRAFHANLLYQEHGLLAERKGNSFEILGVPRDLIDYRSTRRKQVLAEMAKAGTSGGKAAAIAALASRSSKSDLPPLSQLREQWPEEHDRLYGFNAKYIEALRVTVRETKQHIPALLEQAAENVVKVQHHFTAHDFLREALLEAPQYSISPDDLIPAAQKYLVESGKIIAIPNIYGSQRYTTEKVLQEEHGLLTVLQTACEQKGAVLSDKKVNAAIAVAQEEAKEKGYSLNEEQIAGIRHLTQDKHSVRLLQGYAGVGKTTATLRPTVKAFQSAGYKVVGTAYTGVAAQQLARETGIPCDTIHMTLADFETDWIESTKQYAKHTVRQLARASKKRKTWKYKGKPKPVSFDSKTVILIDEAGMVGCRQTRILLERAERAGATVLFVGDYAQLGAIEGTSAFYSMCQRLGHAKITDIVRQKNAWAREAARHFAVGNVAAALKLYEKRRHLKSYDDVEMTMSQLIEHWAEVAAYSPKKARIIAGTNDQIYTLNQMAQQRRLDEAPASGLKHINRSLTIEHYDDKTSRTYESQCYVGDRIVFTKTSRKLGVFNGSAGTVTAFDGGKIQVELDHGDAIKVPVMGKKAFRNVRLGYASTTEKGQGSTFPMVFTLLAGSTMDLPHSYVQGTRSTDSTWFYTTKDLYDELQGLEESPLVSLMERAADLSLAADLFTSPAGAADSFNQLHDKIVEDWFKLQGKGIYLPQIITATPEEATELNERCHQVQLAMAQSDWEKKKTQSKEFEETVEEIASAIIPSKQATDEEDISELKQTPVESIELPDSPPEVKQAEVEEVTPIEITPEPEPAENIEPKRADVEEFIPESRQEPVEPSVPIPDVKEDTLPDEVGWGEELENPNLLEVKGIPLVEGTPIEFTSVAYGMGIHDGDTGRVSFVDRIRGSFSVVMDLGNRVKTFFALDKNKIRLNYAHDYSYKTFQTKMDLEITRLTMIERGLPAPPDSLFANPHLYHTSTKPDYKTTHDFLQWEPADPSPATIYSTPSTDITNLDGQSTLPSGSSYIYKQTESLEQQNKQQQEYAMQATEWANKMQAINQTVNTHTQQAAYLQQVGHANSQTKVQSQTIGF